MHSLARPPHGVDVPAAELPILELVTDLVEVRDRRQLGATALGVVRALNTVTFPPHGSTSQLAVFVPNGELVTAFGGSRLGRGLRMYLGADPRTERQTPRYTWTNVMQQLIDGPRDDNRVVELADTLMAGVDGVYEIEAGEPLSAHERHILQSKVSALAIAQRGHGNEPIWLEAYTHPPLVRK